MPIVSAATSSATIVSLHSSVAIAWTHTSIHACNHASVPESISNTAAVSLRSPVATALPHQLSVYYETSACALSALDIFCIVLARQLHCQLVSKVLGSLTDLRKL